MFLKNNYINVKHIVAKFNLKNKTFRVYDNLDNNWLKRG